MAPFLSWRRQLRRHHRADRRVRRLGRRAQAETRCPGRSARIRRHAVRQVRRWVQSRRGHPWAEAACCWVWAAARLDAGRQAVRRPDPVGRWGAGLQAAGQLARRRHLEQVCPVPRCCQAAQSSVSRPYRSRLS